MTPERIAKARRVLAEEGYLTPGLADELLAAAEQLAAARHEAARWEGLSEMQDKALAAAQERIRFLEMEYAKLLEHNSDLEEACEAVKSLTQCDVKMSGKRYYFRTSRSSDVHDAILLTLQALEKKKQIIKEEKCKHLNSTNYKL